MHPAPGICTTEAAPHLPRTYTIEYVHKTMLGKSTRTIQRWRIVLGFPRPKVIGTGNNGTAVYLADEVDAWITKRLK